MVKPDFPIRTERLLLRPFTADDLDDFLAYRALPEVRRYLYNDASTRDECGKVLAQRVGETELTAAGQRLILAVELDGRVIGDAMLKWLSEKDRQGEIGYSLHPAFQGRGYATEVARTMLTLGFDELGLHRIVAECDPRNEPSWRLMERLGMRREAHFREWAILRGEWSDLVVYALLAEERRSRP
nr:GNAT family N-acetyltransferase [Lentzea sp. NBRC 102530]